MKDEFVIIKTTYPKILEAKKLAQILLEKKLAFCVQFLKIESMFVWDQKISCEEEILVEIKTKSQFFMQIEQLILAHHSYEVPQIIAIKIEQISSKYKNWAQENL